MKHKPKQQLLSIMSEPIDALHAAWCEATSQKLHPRASERILFELHKCDVKPDDLTLVVKHLQGQNKKFGGGAAFRINLQKVAGDPETFLCLLAEAQATKRNYRPAPTPKEQVLQQLRPTVDPEQASTMTQSGGRHISEVFQAMHKAAGQ